MFGLSYLYTIIKYPERWSGNTRDWSLDKTVWLNPPSGEDEEQVKIAE